MREVLVREMGGGRMGWVGEGSDAVEAEDLHALTESFMTTAAHELCGPLACVSAGLELLLSDDGTCTREHRRLCLETMQDGVDRLTQVTQRLLDASSAALGRARLRREGVDMRQLLAGLEPALRQMAGARQQRLELEMPTDLPSAYIDPERVAGIVRDVVENASLYSARETTIRLTLVPREPDMVRLVVQDEGIGIRPEEARHIFTPFYRGEAARRMTPHGLGMSLAAAHTIVEQHGGDLRFVSIPGQGTVFYLDLPIYWDDLAGQENGEDGEFGAACGRCGKG